MKLFEVYPVNNIEIIRGKGSLLWDSHKNEYLDMYGGHAVISIGHGHPHYIKRICEQLNNIGFYSNSIKIPAQQKLTDKLGQVSGKPHYRLFLCNSGAEAVENALKLASFYNGRKKVIAFENAFHGRTSLAVAVSDHPGIRAAINSTTDIIRMPWNEPEALQEEFRKSGNEIAAVIVEGIQGVGGIHVAEDIFLQRIRQLCDEYNSVFVADEVQCGYGRSGFFFSTDRANVEADIYCVAKGMGNGFPIAGIAVCKKFTPRYGILGSTFGGNHLACVAALAVLEVIEDEVLVEHAEKTGNYLIREISGLQNIKTVRGKGLMIGIELPEDLGHVRNTLLTEHKVFTGMSGSNVIRLLPALNLTMNNAERFLAALENTLKK